MIPDKYINIQKFVNQYVEFSPEEFEVAIKYIEIRELKRNDILLNEGEVADIIVFTNKGYLRVYYNHDGEEITRDITPLHTFATALPSFINQIPSYEIISAIIIILFVAFCLAISPFIFALFLILWILSDPWLFFTLLFILIVNKCFSLTSKGNL